MTVLDPPRTLLLTAGLALLAGAGCALLAASLIYVASRFLPPRLPGGRVWADWRRKRLVWGLVPPAAAGAAYLCGEAIARAVGLRDLYWLTRGDAILWIGRLGSLCGYLLALLVLVTAALARRRGARKT